MSHPERIQELLADRAVWGLSETEERELQQHLGTVPEDPSFEAAAAAVTAAHYARRDAAAPDRLMHTLGADALCYFAHRGDITLASLAGTRHPEPEALDAPAAEGTWPPPTRIDPVIHRDGGGSSSTGWWVAAAAALLAAILAWQLLPAPMQPTAVRQELVADGAWSESWSTGPSPLSGTPTGDVVWSDTQQMGVMRLRGLPKNDPEQQQYQLWIFDKTRDGQLVDGGVFDIADDGTEALIVVDAKLGVGEATGFAITLESKGGVVVSAQEHIVATAGL
ncbi:MAG: anti-sigma factor [Planctomycetota bacterium]